MPFSNHLLITCQAEESKFLCQNIEEYRSGFIDLHLWNSDCFPPCRSRDYSFRSVGKGDSENQGWRGCWDKNRLKRVKRAKSIVHSVLSWESFKSEVWTYVCNMPKYVLSLDASKVKKKSPVCFALKRLPCFRGTVKHKGSLPSDITNPSIKRVWLHVCTAPHHTAPGKNTVP